MKDIMFHCPHCAAKLIVESQGAGMGVPCPHCTRNIIIPSSPKPTEAVSAPQMEAFESEIRSHKPMAILCYESEELHFAARLKTYATYCAANNVSLNVFGFHSGGASDFMIVFTGSLADHSEQSAASQSGGILDKLNYELLNDAELALLKPVPSYSNFAAPGCQLLSLAGFEQCLSALRSGSYKLVVPNINRNIGSKTTAYGGTVVAWGWYQDGRTRVPVGLSDVIAVAAGRLYSVALQNDGSVVEWGTLSTADRGWWCPRPDDLREITAIAAGEEHIVALRADGKVFAWGSVACDQCAVPATLKDVVAIAAAREYSLALTRNGSVVIWGDKHERNDIPLHINDAKAIAARYETSLVLKHDGSVMGWGFYSAVPPGLCEVAAIAAGYTHHLAVKIDGTVIAWGSNTDGNGKVCGKCDVPAGLSDVIAVTAGGDHSLALKRDGGVIAWGGNCYTESGYNKPAGQIEMPHNLTNVSAIAAGKCHNLALIK